MHDSLGDRMKRYEKTFDNKLMPNVPVFIRVDGRAFHTLTRGMKKPFDHHLISCMVAAARETAKEMSGFKLAYVQSDECTFMLQDYENKEAQGWFGYEVNKLVSITASAFTGYFNQAYKLYENMGLLPKLEKPAMFDARAFNVPLHDAPNVFVWRQQDWARNSLQMLARGYFSHKDLDKKNTAAIHEMLHEKGVNWANMPNQLKNGTFVMQNGSLDLGKMAYDDLEALFNVFMQQRFVS